MSHTNSCSRYCQTCSDVGQKCPFRGKMISGHAPRILKHKSGVEIRQKRSTADSIVQGCCSMGNRCTTYRFRPCWTGTNIFRTRMCLMSISVFRFWTGWSVGKLGGWRWGMNQSTVWRRISLLFSNVGQGTNKLGQRMGESHDKMNVFSCSEPRLRNCQESDIRNCGPNRLTSLFRPRGDDSLGKVFSRLWTS